MGPVHGPAIPQTGCASWIHCATIAVIEGIARGGGSEWAMAVDMRWQPVARARLQAILDAGAQTRDFELGGLR